MKYDIITIGGAVEDITFYTKGGLLIDNKKDILRQRLLAFEYGAKIKIKSAHSTFGGGAANVAVSARRLGLKSACVCAVGYDDRGKQIIKNLKSQKVDVRYAQKIRGKMSGFSFLLVGPENEHIIFPYRAANDDLEISETFLRRLKTEWIYITSLTGDWKQNLSNIFHHGKNFKLAWNPGFVQLSEGQDLIRKNLKNVHVFNVNKDEAIELVARDKKVMRNRRESSGFLNDVKNLLKIISGYGPRIAIITSGKKGADAYDGSKFYHADIKKEQKKVDTTGIGDAFGSSTVCGLKLYQGDIQRAIELGINNSASVIAEQGAQNGLIKL